MDIRLNTSTCKRNDYTRTRVSDNLPLEMQFLISKIRPYSDLSCGNSSIIRRRQRLWYSHALTPEAVELEATLKEYSSQRTWYRFQLGDDVHEVLDVVLHCLQNTGVVCRSGSV
jgi:hypothetical protein